MRLLSGSLLVLSLALPGCCCGGVIPVGSTSDATPPAAASSDAARVTVRSAAPGAAPAELASHRRTAL